MMFDYEAAEDALQHQGSIFTDDGFESGSSPGSSPATSSSSPGSPEQEQSKSDKDEPVPDRFMRRILRRCRKDRELQRYLESKQQGNCSAAAGAAATASKENANVLGDLEVIDCDSSDDTPTETAKSPKKMPPNGASSSPASNASPEAKRRKCGSASSDKAKDPSSSDKIDQTAKEGNGKSIDA